MTVPVDLVFATVFLFALIIVGLFAAWRFAVMDGNDTDGFLKACQAERDRLNAEAEEAAEQVKKLSKANKVLRVINHRQHDLLNLRADTISQVADERDTFRRQTEAAQAKLAAIIDTACGNCKEDVA